MNADDVRAGLVEVLAPIFGPAIAIDDLHMLPGGASRTTWAFVFERGADEATQSLILQSARRGGPASSMEVESMVQGLARAAGTPVRRLITASDAARPFGVPYLVAHAVPGGDHRSQDTPPA